MGREQGSHFGRYAAALFHTIIHNIGNKEDYEKVLPDIRLHYQHAHFIPIVVVGKERRTLIGPW